MPVFAWLEGQRGIGMERSWRTPINRCYRMPISSDCEEVLRPSLTITARTRPASRPRRLANDEVGKSISEWAIRRRLDLPLARPTHDPWYIQWCRCTHPVGVAIDPVRMLVASAQLVLAQRCVDAQWCKGPVGSNDSRWRAVDSSGACNGNYINLRCAARRT